MVLFIQDKLVNTVAHTGLVDAHAYSITGVTEVNYCKRTCAQIIYC